mmetsp:Transcript_6844/g.12412  ORF Transcript_6844/g.12412 Transcript_6844/m.12412 type:complete len:163 (+) Transcript_6844:637-1125(+)
MGTCKSTKSSLVRRGRSWKLTWLSLRTSYSPSRFKDIRKLRMGLALLLDSMYCFLRGTSVGVALSRILNGRSPLFIFKMSQPAFLMKAAHRYANCTVGRMLMHRLRQVLVEQPFITDEDVVTELKICRHCSAALQPGINCSFTVAKARHAKYKNCVEYTCRV